VRQLDIICCSLDDQDIFNKSKSAVKALEAMASERILPNGRKGGAVPICTDMKLYRRAVNHGYNGYLTSNDQWYETLKRVIENEQERLDVAEKGYKWVKKNRDIRDNHVLWMRTYKKLLREH
jgi:glycosyltransferase involved in cell wall biosynthesis